MISWNQPGSPQNWNIFKPESSILIMTLPKLDTVNSQPYSSAPWSPKSTSSMSPLSVESSQKFFPENQVSLRQIFIIYHHIYIVIPFTWFTEYYEYAFHFISKSAFLIPISWQPNAVNLWILLDQCLKYQKIYTIRSQRYMELESLSLWQRLNSFINKFQKKLPHPLFECKNRLSFSIGTETVELNHNRFTFRNGRFYLETKNFIPWEPENC